MRVVLKSLRLFLLSFPLTFSSVAVSQNGASDALALCKDLSPTNRAMAKSAGYDVDAICSGLSQMTAPAPAAAQAKSEAITTRPIAAQETLSLRLHRDQSQFEFRLESQHREKWPIQVRELFAKPILKLLERQ